MLNLPSLQQDIVSSGNQEIRKEAEDSLPPCDVSVSVRLSWSPHVKRHAGEAGAGPHAVLRSWIKGRMGAVPCPCALLSMTVPLLQSGSSLRAFASDQVK